MTTPSDPPLSTVGPAPCGHPGCAAPALRLTPWRARALEMLRAQGKAMGAYDLIARLGAEAGKAVAPITVYRALDGLMEARLIHRLASKNAYLACRGGHCASESVAFLICERCGEVAEAASGALRGDLRRLAEGEGFAARAETIEILGVCARCRAAV
jgi:Fur family zinc uptake transcriptional regulator